ncbi:RDD family protein [Mastigocoleus sp. MO_188.B34]|uniref:protein kinase domain-containing protein n=1 Tax=Mastigocoleus sp. MO_188.B34 TaxID=3036635 RepID=UPI00260CA055|nr:RDD family protein [Mastigocoleus sp. MO_188.B34]MDJ0693784.1 RDD family protein [Mastigocoleus sp. MO_188.B34]
MSLCINPRCFAPNNDRNMQFCQACGSELLLQGRFRVVRELGGGGFGKTYELIDNTGKTKVLKVLIDNAPKAVELFEREAEVLSLLDHPGIPKVEKDGYFLYIPRNSKRNLHCLVMEKIEGLTLYKYLKQQGNRPIDPELAIKWLRELTIILQQLHNQHFFHRDIKPTNIMLRTDGHLTLIDFGTVRQVTRTYVAKKAVGDVTGIISSGYTPLEQINGQAVQQSDFFALGRTFIYLLTGKDPNKFYNPYTNVLEWRDVVPGISLKFADLLDWMMAVSAAKRPQNTQVILRTLGEIDGIFPPEVNVKPSTNSLIHQFNPVIFNVKYASLLERFLAFTIDLIILFFIGNVIGVLLPFILSFVGIPVRDDDIHTSLWMGSVGWFSGTIGLLIDTEREKIISTIVGIVINWLYFTLFESSVKQGTPGKQILNINVTNSSQEKISLLQANIRYFANIISTISLMLGYILAAFTLQKQALHDKVSNTFIIKKR